MERKAKKEVFLLYCGNTWLDKSSLEMIAICATLNKAVELAVEDARENSEAALSADEVAELERICMTQGSEENYLIRSEYINEFIY